MTEKDLPGSLKFEDLKNYSIAELDDMAIQIGRRGEKKHLHNILEVRKSKLNYNFEWTPEKKAKLLRLDGMILDCFRKLETEARNTLQIIQNRIDSKDEFLHDFNMHAVVKPYIYEEDADGEKYENGDVIEEVLTYNWKDWCLSFIVVSTKCFNDISYLDKNFNYNKTLWFEGKFDDCFISYAIYEICENAVGWSFPDILKINHLSAELKIDYQHFMDL